MVGGGVPVPVGAPVPVDDGGESVPEEAVVCANEIEEKAKMKRAATSMRRERSDGMFALLGVRLQRASDVEESKRKKVGNEQVRLWEIWAG